MEEQCKQCKGSGFTRREKPYSCPGSHPNLVACMYCENVDKGAYTTCSKCYGVGRVNINGVNETPHMSR